MFVRALHLFPQDFRKHGAAHGGRTRLSDVGHPVTTREHSLQRLLDPVASNERPKASRSIIVALRTEPIGLAESVPARDGAEP